MGKMKRNRYIILLNDRGLVTNRKGEEFMDYKSAEREVMYGIGALYPESKYTIYELIEREPGEVRE